MVDQKKENASRLRLHVRRAAKASGTSETVLNNSDQRDGDPGNSPGAKHSTPVSSDLGALERRVLGAVRGAVTDVLKEGRRHPVLPDIDMDFIATETLEKTSRTEIQTEKTRDVKKFGSAIMTGAVVGLVISVVAVITGMQFNIFSDAQKLEKGSVNDGVLAGLPESSKQTRPLTADTMPKIQPPKLNQVRRLYSTQSPPQIATPSAERVSPGVIARPSTEFISEQAGQQRPTMADEKLQPVREGSKLSNGDDQGEQLLGVLAVEAKAQHEAEERSTVTNATEDYSPPPLDRSASIGQLIVLRLKGGTIEFTGRLKEYDATKYVLTLPNSRTVTVRTDLYDCISVTCPETTN